jgi:hypothetical protein
MPVLWWMRAVVATGMAVVLAGVAGGAQAREASIYRGKCGEVVLPAGPTGLESAVRVRTACGTFTIDRRGVRSTGPYWVGWKYEGLISRRGRLTLFDKNRVLWRSRGRRHGVASWFAPDGRRFAFMAYGRRLHIAHLDGPERAVGHRGEYPLGWTRAGQLVTSQEHVLRVRTRAGRLVRILESEAGNRTFDAWSRTLVYVSRNGALIRTDGLEQTFLARGVRRWVDIRPLEEGRIAVIDRRLVVLNPDGSVLASDRRHYNLPALTSRGPIALIATGPLDGRSRATESVRLLRPGDGSSTLLHTAYVGALGCGHWPTLAWRGEELLYSTSEGHVVVMEPGSGRKLDLTTAVKRLPGEFLEARWS